MLTSLFGDLGAPKDSGAIKPSVDDAPDPGFNATAILQTVATEVNARGQMVDRHSLDLVVSGSPAQAIREHFATTRADLETATSLITLLDPAGVWASSVIKALSDAGGRPIERLHLREPSTLRTLATVERTTLVRRHEDTLRIYHADVRAPGSDNAEIPVALMERSQLTTVIIGPQQPHAVDALLEALRAAATLPTWRCPALLFLLPPNTAWIANKIAANDWPGRLHVSVLSEAMRSASTVWNAILGVWTHLRSQPGWGSTGNPPLPGMNEFPIKVGDLIEPVQTAAPTVTTVVADAPLAASIQADAPLSTDAATTPSALRTTRSVLDLTRAKEALASLLMLDGLLGCAVVDSANGAVLAHETRNERPVDLGQFAAASAQVMRSHREAARGMGLSERIDEVIASAGPRLQILRTVSGHPQLLIVALLDKHRTNLTLARLQMTAAERGMA